MNWDWEKLKQQQNQGGIPPQMDEFVKQVKKLKFPGSGPLIILAIVLLFIGLFPLSAQQTDPMG